MQNQLGVLLEFNHSKDCAIVRGLSTHTVMLGYFNIKEYAFLILPSSLSFISTQKKEFFKTSMNVQFHSINSKSRIPMQGVCEHR